MDGGLRTVVSGSACDEYSSAFGWRMNFVY